LSPDGGFCFVVEVVLPFHGIPVSHITGVLWSFVIGTVLARVVNSTPMQPILPPTHFLVSDLPAINATEQATEGYSATFPSPAWLPWECLPVLGGHGLIHTTPNSAKFWGSFSSINPS
jgi:hypothetical protein